MHAKADAGSSDGEREDVKVSLAPDFSRRRGEIELYDLVALPEHAAVIADLRRAALEWWRETGGGPLDLP